ncbi:ankyrin repeat-containing domain protein, partial [Terfezia claveryi]
MGVYDEIAYQMKFQQSISAQLATLALKWMLVSQRPLKPQELVTAVKLDPTKPLKSTSAPQQQSSVEVDIVINSCGGLISWDKTLNVIRYSHLSVQEYFEMNNIFLGDPIDTQLLVAESCLLTLQDSHHLTPLYQYAALNWFRHCRSYQDLVLQHAGTRKSLDLTPDIPLLRSFLGSFNRPSIDYMKWLDWLLVSQDINDKEKQMAAVLRSQPVFPIFAAAFTGLGELAGWLWHSKDVDINLRNHEETPLLHLACQYGTRWIVETLLAQRAAIYTVHHDLQLCTPLHVAAYYGRLDIVTLLLERGADINLAAGYYGTALCAAASQSKLEIVSLLLDRGADINVAAGYYGTALCAAASQSKLEIVSLLLDRGADINATIDSHHGTALYAAASHSKLEVVSLVQAIARAEGAVEATPEDHPDRAAMLNNLGTHLSRRYERTGNMQDLKAAIATVKAAVEATSEDHPDRAAILNNLGGHLSRRYERTGNLLDLEA